MKQLSYQRKGWDKSMEGKQIDLYMHSYYSDDGEAVKRQLEFL